MTRRTILLALIPAALLAQSPNGHVLIGNPDDGGKLQVAGTAMVAKPRVWKGNDGSRWTWDATTGLPNRLPDKVRWMEYGLYGAAVAADYGSTRYALSHGAREVFPLYRCSPARAGCMNSVNFWAIAAIPAATWLINDLWLGKHTSSRIRRFGQIGRKIVIGSRFGVAAYNVGIAHQMKGKSNGK